MIRAPVNLKRMLQQLSALCLSVTSVRRAHPETGAQVKPGKRKRNTSPSFRLKERAVCEKPRWKEKTAEETQEPARELTH